MVATIIVSVRIPPRPGPASAPSSSTFSRPRCFQGGPASSGRASLALRIRTCVPLLDASTGSNVTGPPSPADAISTGSSTSFGSSSANTVSIVS